MSLKTCLTPPTLLEIEIYHQLTKFRDMVARPCSPCVLLSVANRFKTLAFALILLSSSFFWLLAFRFVSLPFLIASWVLFIKFGGQDLHLSLATWAVGLALTFSPIDVLPLPKGGPPRLVPLLMGLPTRETAERANRGEVLLGGCIVSGYEPKYYLVW